MFIVFQGIESKHHWMTLQSVLDMFDEPPVVPVGISYKSLLSRRLGPSYINEVAVTSPVVLESGATNVPMTSEEAEDFAAEYYEFLVKVPSVTLALEFLHPALSGHRAPKELSPRILPVWNGKDVKDLGDILESDGSVAMTYHKDKRIPTLLRRTSGEGTLMAMGLPDLAEAKRAGFNAVLLGSWLTPGKFGDVILWDGAKYHRTSDRKIRYEVIAENSALIRQFGFDTELLLSGDTRESLRLAAHSYIRWTQSLVLASDRTEASMAAEPVKSEIGSTKTSRKRETLKRAPMSLPGFTHVPEESVEVDEETGMDKIHTRSHLRTVSDTVRSCDGCYLSSTCPAYEAGSSCAYHFPVEVRSESQVKALMSSMLELQATRVAFARFAEESNGGYPDAVVGQEIDRLVRMVDQVDRRKKRRERLTLSVESESSNGGTGVLSRIFGGKAQVGANRDSEPPQVLEAKVLPAEIQAPPDIR